MGRFCSARTCVGSTKSEPDANTCSCSLTRNSVADQDATTCSTRQISFMRGDPTEGSRGSSCGSRDHSLFVRLSEGSHEKSKHSVEPLYHKLLYSTFQGAPGNGEGTRDSTRSFMDERPMEPMETRGISERGTEGSHGGHSEASDRIRWKDEVSLASGGNERSTTSQGRPWSIRKDMRESHLQQQQQESWSSRSRSASFHDIRHKETKMSGRDDKADEDLVDAERELSFSGRSRGAAEREEDSPGHEKDDAMEVEDESTGGDHWRKVEQSWLHGIVNQPIPQMAKNLHEVPDGSLESLKVCLRDILGSSKRKDEFVTLQRILQQRSDLTPDSLLGSHRTQLEILVALKTGIPAFLHPDVAIPTAALTEIFLGTRCRNIGCQNPLPADFCGCKVCSSKWGFCNACMCGVCSKFDFDSNTCSWIGCDFCLHWCHADCGIQLGHISSRKSTGRSSGDPVMQFKCVACGHMSELYGFVEEVFTACAKDWSLEVLARELQCIRRIFHRSEDLKGKQLFGKAEQLLVKLDTSRDVEAVWQSMMKFFASGRKGDVAPRAKAGVQVVRDAIPLPPGRKVATRQVEADREIDVHVLKALNGDGHRAGGERDDVRLSDQEMGEEGNEAAELLRERAWQRAQLKELESILEIKQAEAEVFQKRADEISKEAEGLQRIVQAKIEKFDEEYNYKLLKLCASASLRRERESAIALRM